MIPFTSRSVEEAFASTETANIANVEITATFKNVASTVKLGDKEWFDKEQISAKEPFPMTNCQFTS